jgi:hypothetical protein
VAGTEFSANEFSQHIGLASGLAGVGIGKTASLGK